MVSLIITFKRKIREICNTMAIITEKYSNTHAPLSVVIPCYNCKDTLEKTLASVFGQTWLPKEVILVDDGSECETLQEIKKLQNSKKYQPLTVIYLQNNVGPSAARNKGWDLARQPYVAFLDADDIWDKHKVAIQLPWMQQHKDVFFTGHRYSLCQDNCGYQGDGKREIAYREISFLKLLFKNYFSTPCVMIKRSIGDRFPEDQKYAEDYGLWLNILSRGCKAVFLNVNLAWGGKQYLEQKGLSSKHYRMEKAQNKVYNNLLRLGKINLFLFIVVRIWSFIKYVRRIMMIYYHRLWYKQ